MLVARFVSSAVLGFLPVDISTRAGEIAERVRANPELLRILIGVGVTTASMFFVGIAKQALKAAFVGGAMSVIVWFWYFNIR